MRFAILAVTTILAAAPAFAADLGTYRPGTPYHSTQVPAADVCESTCAGDAQCEGWNFVKPNPQAPGVCELQSQIGAPVSSAISISGVNARRSVARSNVVRGDTNTIRVGTASAPAPRRAGPVQQPGQRRIVREPVPQARRAPQPAAYPAQPVRRAAPQPRVLQQQPGQRPAQPRFQPMLDGRPVARGPQAQRPQFQSPQGRTPQPPVSAPRQQQAAPPRGSVRRRDARLAPRPQNPAAPNIQARPPVGQPIAPAASPRPPVPTAMPTRSAAQPLTYEQAQTSLFGSLHDDVRVPASNAAVPTDPKAPIPTSQARPVAPVAQEQLAGAVRR